MKVGINMAITKRGISGTARVAKVIERALNDVPGCSVTSLAPDSLPTRGGARRAYFDAKWDLWDAPRLAHRLDALVSPCNVGRGIGSTANILWMHDTMVLDQPQWFDRRYAAYARVLFNFSVQRSSVVVTGSEYSRDRIRSWWPAGTRVKVIRWPIDVRASGARTPPETKIVLIVGATDPRKNHEAAIDGVRMARLRTGLDLRLRIIGPPGRADPYVDGLIRAADPDRRWVERLRDVSDEELDALIAEAWLLVQPSRDEGFGLPPLEAAAWGVPSLHSGRGSLPEVVSSGNLDSCDGAELASGIVEMMHAETYRKASDAALVDAGKQDFGSFANDLAGLLRETGL